MKRLVLCCLIAVEIPAAFAEDPWTMEYVPGYYDAHNVWHDGHWRKVPFSESHPKPQVPYIPAEDVSFELTNNTPYVVRRVVIQAQRIPGSVFYTYHAPTTDMKVMPNGGYTTITTHDMVASVNKLYDVSFYLISPEDKDKPEARTRISTVSNENSAK
jgi:hypothetical protein